MKKRRPSPDEIKERIIRVSGEMFGAHGFHGTTIRDITKKAGVNVAAVHYHFRDKSELYIRILREAKIWSRDLVDTAFEGAAEEQLRSFIVAFVGYLLDPERPSWHVRVITQELLNPTRALDVLVRELTEPIFRRFRHHIAAVAGGSPLSDEQLDLLASSIIGQCLFYVRSGPMLERLAPELSVNPDRIDRIAQHIASFSLAAIRGLHYSKFTPPLEAVS